MPQGGGPLKLKDEFLPSLRTSRTSGSIKGYTQLAKTLIRENDLSTSEEYLDIALDQIDRMSRLILELLDVSRIETGRLEIRREPIAWSLFVRDVVRLHHTALSGRRFQINIADDGKLVNGDRDRLEQVLGNLMENAVKYSPDGSEIVVSVEDKGDQIVTAVSDQGIGIPVDELGQVFERFHRGRQVSSTNYGGLGLGLYITKQIVERHGGTIWVESKEGIGTTFHFTLPLDQGRGCRIRAEPHPGQRRDRMTAQRFCVRVVSVACAAPSSSSIAAVSSAHRSCRGRAASDWTRESLTATWRHYTQIVGGMEVEGAGVIERIDHDGSVHEEYRELVAAPPPGPRRMIAASDAMRALPAGLLVEQKLVALNDHGSARPVWRIVVEQTPHHPFAHYVDAATGELLRAEPLFSRVQARVFDVNPVAKLNRPDLADNNAAASAVPDAAYSIVDLTWWPAGPLAGLRGDRQPDDR